MTKEQKEQFINYMNQLYGGQQGLVITATRNNVAILNGMSQCIEDVVKLINSCETTETNQAKQAVDEANKAIENANNATK